MKDIKAELNKRLEQIKDIQTRKVRAETIVQQKMQDWKKLGINTTEEAKIELQRRLDANAELELKAINFIEEFDKKFKAFL